VSSETASFSSASDQRSPTALASFSLLRIILSADLSDIGTFTFLLENVQAAE
jgi:hypothetical protein